MKFSIKFVAFLLISFAWFTGCKKDTEGPANAVTDVSLYSETASLVAGSSSTFTATIEPKTATNKEVTWASSDENVITVTEIGLVTAVNIGTATLTATTKDGAKTASCVITVTESIIELISVSLKNPPVSLPLNGTVQLQTVLVPAAATSNSIKWTSSDASILTVNETGLVTAVAEGTATVTVSSIDGSITTSCEITVTSDAIAVTGVSLPATEFVTLDKTKQFTAVLTPALATNNALTWTTSNPAVATVSETGVVTGVSLGVTTITVTTVDGNKTASCEVTVEKENLLVNAGFENDLNNYTKNYGTSSRIVTDPAFVHSGSKALAIGPEGDEGRGQIITSGFTTGVSYTFTAWCRVDVTTGNSIEFGIMCFDAGGSRILNVSGGPNPKSLTYENLSYSAVIPEGTASVHVYFYNNGGRTLFTDDWTFTKD